MKHILTTVKGHAPAYAKAGAKAVVLVARNTERLNNIALQLNKSYPKVETLVLSADISDSVKVTELFQRVNETYGHADILVNNAAILKADGLLGSEDPEVWWEDLVSMPDRGCLPVYMFTMSPTAYQCARNFPDDSRLPQVSASRVSRHNH